MPRSSEPSSYSLTTAEKVRKRADYVRIQGSGHKFPSPSILTFVSRAKLELPRVGITVSKRVGNAVTRNRVKRLLRESFRLQKQMFPKDLELVLVARADAAKAGFHEIFHEVREISRRVNAWRSRS